jgi:hypothetical protein
LGIVNGNMFFQILKRMLEVSFGVLDLRRLAKLEKTIRIKRSRHRIDECETEAIDGPADGSEICDASD